MPTIKTDVTFSQCVYLNKLAKAKERTMASLIRYALKRYCTTDGLKDEETGKKLPYPDR